MDPSLGARGKREASDGNKPKLLHGRVPFAAKLRGNDNGIPGCGRRKIRNDPQGSAAGAAVNGDENAS
jgi:hypothetical protein